MLSLKNNIPRLKWLNFWTDFRPHEVIMILYFAQITGSYTLAMSLYSIGALSSMIFEVPTGILSDYLGRKGVVIASISMTIICLVVDIWAPSYIYLAAASVVAGIAYALQSGNNEALLYESVENKEHYTEISGKVGSMFQLGLGCSALFTAIASTIVDFRMIFLLAIIPQVIGLVVAFRLTEPAVHTERIRANIFRDFIEALKLFKTNSRLRLLSIGQIISYGLGEAMYGIQSGFFALFWPTWAISISRFIQHILGFWGAHSAGFWKKQINEGKIVIRFQIINKAIDLVAFIFPSILSPILITLGNYPWGVSDTAVRSLLQHEFSDKQRATMGSLNAFAGKLLLGLAMIALGWLADNWDMAKALTLFQILSVLGIVSHWLVFRKSATK